MGKARHPHDSSRPEPANVRRALENHDIEALVSALSFRQKRFAEEYVVDFNGAAAAIRAGYSTNHADKQAYILSKHKGVSAYIDHLARSKQAKIISIDPDYIIQKTVDIITKDGVKDGDALRGLEMLARHLGMFIERQEITGKDGGPIEMQKIEEEAQGFVDQLKTLTDRVDRADKVVLHAVK